MTQKIFRFELWSDWINSFNGRIGTWNEIEELVDIAIERGDFFTLRII